ncbi:MAG: hypothetical protein U0942_06175 [Parvibaculum sp.]|uniref:hypothetical protein n=1 Tax=Parvibaculum sp. TaxID=2024848 RepID=UPI002ABBDC0D|nr:hypothetical protein [Parvibaculum sp.]MDZ4380909.1 hypothetical protein [Parvibaculum sp.]
MALFTDFLASFVGQPFYNRRMIRRSRHRWFVILLAVCLAAGTNLAAARGMTAELADAGASMALGASAYMGACAERGGMTADTANEMCPGCNEPADGTCTGMGSFCQSAGALNLPETLVLSALGSQRAYRAAHFHRSGRPAVPNLTPPRFS